MTNLVRGVRDLGRGFEFLNQHPRLWGWVVAPAVATLLVLGGMIALVAMLAAPAVDWIVGWVPFLGEAARWLAWLIVIGGLLAGGWLLFARVIGLVAGPLCEVLSEKVEEQLTGKAGEAFSMSRFAGDAVVGVAHSVRRLIAALFALLLVFAISFVPVLGSLAGLGLGGWIAARGAAYDSYDGVLARRRLAYQAKLAFLDAHRARTIGLGAAVAAMLLVPGLNLIALGLGTTAATLAVHELEGGV